MRLYLQLAAGAAQDPGADLLALIEKHHSMCCQTCSCHGGHGVLHHSDLTHQSAESEDTPAEHAVCHATPAWHAVLHEPLGEHAVPDETPAEHPVYDGTPAAHDATPAEHAVCDIASAEHAAHDAVPAGRAAAFHYEVSDAAGPAQVPGFVQLQALLHLVGDQAAAVGLLR